jgi:hypothetical protein
MGYPANAVAAAGGAPLASSVKRIRERRLAREAHKELHIAGLERTNLFLVGNGAVPMLMDMLGLVLQSELILRWRPGQPLELPSPGRAGTLILQDVDGLPRDEQHKLLRWLDQSAGQIRMVSTSNEPLWPRVKTGAFSEVLYYRLNIVYIDAGSPAD